MSPVLWLMLGNMAVWIGFGGYLYIIWTSQKKMHARLVRLELYEKEVE